MAHPANTSAIRVVGRSVRAGSHTHCCLSMHRFPPEMICCSWWSMRPVSIVFFNYRPPGCVTPHRCRHILLGLPVRGATPEYENSRNESSLSSATRSGSLVSSDSPEFTVDGASAGAVSMPSASAMFSPASRGKRALHDGVRAVPTPPTQSKASDSARFPDALP